MNLTATEGKVIDLLRRWQIGTKKALCNELLISHMTVVRALKKYGYHSSYNANAAYYTLWDIPTFDEDGLWSHKQIYFSRDGTLEGTVVGLIERSADGFMVSELEKRLGTKVANVLCGLCRKGRIERYCRGRYAVYISADRERGSSQRARREQQLEAAQAVVTARKSGKIELPQGLDVVVVIRLLVQMIKTPKASVASLSQALQAQGVAIDAEQLRSTIAFYCLEKKGAL